MRAVRTGICLVVAALALGHAASARALSGRSWGFVCNPQNHWVRANWPTITTDSSRPTAVWVRFRLEQFTRSGWRSYRTSRRYVGVSNRYQRFYLDTSFGMLPEPFVGSYGHYFAYVTRHGSYAGPQLGPWWSHLPVASYRTRERYWANGRTWMNRGTYAWNTGPGRRWCDT